MSLPCADYYYELVNTPKILNPLMGLFSYFSTTDRGQHFISIVLFKMKVIKMSRWCRTLVVIRISMFSVLFSRISLGSHHNFNIN